MQFKAVVFDLDGTLLDSIEDLSDSMNIVLEKAGFPTHSVQKYKYFVGNGMKQLAVRALPEEFRSPEIVERTILAMSQEYGDRWDNKSRPYEGIPQLLDLLVAKRFDLAVLSNKPDNLAKKIVGKLFSNWKFKAVCGERESVPIKPDPAGALEIALNMGISTNNILYLGDTATDMKTANDAGMYAVGVLWGFREKNELISNGAKVIIEDPIDLIKLIEER